MQVKVFTYEVDVAFSQQSTSAVVTTENVVDVVGELEKVVQRVPTRTVELPQPGAVELKAVEGDTFTISAQMVDSVGNRSESVAIVETATDNIPPNPGSLTIKQVSEESAELHEDPSE